MDEKLEIAIEQLRQGEQQGFQILYDQTHNYVLMQARALLKNEADVHDLVQEVYFNAYRSIGSLQENKKVYAWLGGIAFRQATKILRKQKDIPIGEEETAFDTMIELDEDIQPEHALDKKESAQILKEMLEELPELQKAALLAYYYDEMSVGEIAKAFSCSEGTIKSRLNYARKNLKKAIQEREERDGIKLHSFSLPLLLLAFQAYARECVMGEQMVSGIFQGVCQKIGNMAAGQAYPNQPQPGQAHLNQPSAGQEYPNTPSGHKTQNPTSQVSQNPSGTAMNKMGGTQQAIGKAAGKIAAGSAKGGIPAKAILFVASAVGAVSIGAGIAGYGLMHQNGASQGGVEAGQRQVISELGALNPGISNAVQGVAVEIHGIEEKAAKAKEEKEKAEALKKKKAKKKKEEAKKAAEAAEAASSAEAQPDAEKASAPEPVTGTSAPSVQQPQTPEPTPAPEQPAPEPTPAPEQPAPEPTPEPEQPAPEPIPEPEPAPEPTPENPDDGWGNQAPDLTIEE